MSLFAVQKKETPKQHSGLQDDISFQLMNEMVCHAVQRTPLERLSKHVERKHQLIEFTLRVPQGDISFYNVTFRFK